MIHIYTGNGKGKTTSSIGLSIRAIGAGKKVLFIQFFKDGKSCELKVLKKFKKLKYLNFLKLDKDVLKKIKEEVKKGNYFLVVLDEILHGLKWKMIGIDDIKKLVDKKREWVLTGRIKNLRKLEGLGDYVSYIMEVRHPYRRGIKARRGIEF